VTALSWILGNLNSFFGFGVCIRSGKPSDIDVFQLVLDERHTSLAIFYLTLLPLFRFTPTLVFSSPLSPPSLFSKNTSWLYNIVEPSQVPTLFHCVGASYAFLLCVERATNKRYLAG